MSTVIQVPQQRAAARNFFLILLVLALAALLICKQQFTGDFIEYTLETEAMAVHGTADIRLADVDKLEHMLPDLAWVYELLGKDMRENKEDIYAAFARGRGGKVYSVHFLAYPALAALPFKALSALGLPPFKCFQVVNAIAVIVLGLALFRLFGSGLKAGAGLALFMLCGGVLYWPWSSPECLSAAALLAGLLFYSTGAPVRGGLLGGLATLQNPTIVFFFAFAPLFKLCIDYQASLGLTANLRRQVTPRSVLGLGAGLALFALPPLFNLWQFGVPNIIVKRFSDAALVSTTRLASFFFDLNQGMVISIPAVALLLLCWGWRQDGRWRRSAVLGVGVLAVLAMSVPALAVLNWNSGAAGIMRYVFWCAMPLLFVMFWRLSLLQRWPRFPLALLVLGQAACMVHASTYPYVKFSPLAKLVLRYAPARYHPEPEIFAERGGENDDYINPANIYAYPRNGKPIKWLYNTAQEGIENRLCGPGMILAEGNRYSDSYRHWRYIDGELHCRRDLDSAISLQLPAFRDHQLVTLARGWAEPEASGGVWDGVWTIGKDSLVDITLPVQESISRLSITGHYLEPNQRTRLFVNGADLGWVTLDHAGTLILPAPVSGSLHLELRHETTRQGSASDTRQLAFFMQAITLR